MSNRNFFYITDLYFINSILFLFPLESALDIKEFAFRSIDKYKNFQKIERLKINISLNLTLLLMKENRFSHALLENEIATVLCKKHSDYLRLAICYIRNGICINNLYGFGDEWIIKGKNILIAVEEYKILKVLEEEIERFKVT